MKWKIVTVKEWDEVQSRLKDLERHFVTKRSESGAVVETLADVPMEKRKELKSPSQKGLSWPQRKALLEMTDGFRKGI